LFGGVPRLCRPRDAADRAHRPRHGIESGGKGCPGGIRIAGPGDLCTKSAAREPALETNSAGLSTSGGDGEREPHAASVLPDAL
jgi:hypothetical protein